MYQAPAWKLLSTRFVMLLLWLREHRLKKNRQKFLLLSLTCCLETHKKTGDLGWHLRLQKVPIVCPPARSRMLSYPKPAGGKLLTESNR